MKRILIPASGAVLATGLLAAGLAGTAQAAGDVATDPMAKNAAVAQDIASFWADSNGAALKAATASNVWDNKDITKIKSKGGYSPDSKPGVTPPIGEEKKTTAKVQNVNMPKTIGKVFFVNSKGEKKWCSATSIQSNYRNLVSTAGHCVYDTAGNTDTMSKWVFVPGYYQGKAPWGIYVGKQAFTHYDFDVYEDYDRDYAFVTVYNGISGTIGNSKKVSEDVYKAHKGEKYVKTHEITKAEYDNCKGPDNAPERAECYSKTTKADEVGSPDSDKTALTSLEVSRDKYLAAPKPEGDAAPSKKGDQPANYTQAGTLQKTFATKDEYDKYTGPGYKFVDKYGNYIVEQYFLNVWVVKDVTTIKYYADEFYVVSNDLKDAGRLGDNVGGQGFAWNQPTGKYVRVFGYPAAPHPDGNKPYTGVTPKWCYGKTSAKTVQAAAKKIEEHVALKCAMTEGADGGPWLLKYSNAKRLGYVNGVTSTFADQDGNDRVDTITSPYFDGETASVYNAAKNVWSGKIVN
ncbi:trypsin-like serine peptidase [Nonomuraea sp. NPDC050556]|uniref:trypsin-like serine peptidase n=1 Tax=Nonomuraea sp. NPDC050556 TaxID=3364369 RepID=UPI00378FE642